ncbi:Nucleoprotein TPR [Amphibalanus amphitrite]|uniref:Nucleoprotein TPR n=1 Tax=Amphibalanus amphitrite TaxID=1232801 RepID=A0A6A4VZA3_AMPAM|nr:Nucleoprotein TPR [Amphibalanus amphitrite]
MEEEKRMMEEKELEEKRMMEEKELEEEVERAQQRARLLRAAENELEWERRNDFDDEIPVEVEPNHYDVTRGVRHTSDVLALLDAGAQTSLCREDVLEELGVAGERHPLCIQNVLSDKASLVQQLERCAAEVARLTAELADRGAELAAANAAKCRALAQVGEIAAKEISFQYRERKMASEKEVLEKQMSLLLESLKSQAEELSTLRRQHSSRILQLQADLANQMDQLGTEQAEKERLTQQAADLEQRLTELVEKPRLQREVEIEQEENYRQQLRSQERLAQPFKEGVEKAEARSNEMLRSVDELRSLLSSASEQQSQLEVHLDETHTQHGQYLVERDKVILQLRDRLETYEEQLQAITRKSSLSDEAVEVTSPAAAAVSRLLWQGMTLTQIFTGFTQAKEQLTATEAESKQFKLCLDQILKDIDKWTLAIQTQQEDYEAAVQMIDSPTGSNDEALRELETAHAKPDDARRRLRTVQHKRDRMVAQTEDLAMQDYVPLKEVEKARGGPTPAPQLSSSASLKEFESWRQKFHGYSLLTGVNRLAQPEQKAALLALLDDDWTRVVRYGLPIPEDADMNTIITAMQTHLRRQRNRTDENLPCLGACQVALQLGSIKRTIAVSVVKKLHSSLLSWHDAVRLGILHKEFPQQIRSAISDEEETSRPAPAVCSLKTMPGKSKIPRRVVKRGSAPALEDAGKAQKVHPLKPTWDESKGVPSAEERRKHFSAMKEAFPRVFDVTSKLRKMSGGSMAIELTEDATPVAVSTARSIPFCWRDDIRRQLDELLESDVIEPVEHPAEWCHPIVIYVARNPKDMCVSYFHHTAVFKERSLTLTLGDFADLFMDGEVSQLPYFPHVLEAWKQRHNPNLLFLFFEDMKRDLRGTIQKVADFLGKSLTKEQLDGLEYNLHFDSMKKNPWVNKSMAYAYSPLTAEELEAMAAKEPPPQFMRKGQTGDWRNHMSQQTSDKMDAWIQRELAGSDLKFITG